MASIASLAMGAAAVHAAPGALEREIARIEAGTGGIVGVSARHLPSGVERTYNADLSFPMASTYKVAIGGCVLRELDRGRLSLDEPLPIEPRQRVTSSVLSTQFPHPGLAVSPHNLLELMLTQSDNTATDVLLEAIGGPPAVQRCLEEAGVEDMRVDRSTTQILRQFAGLPVPSDHSQSFLEQYEAMVARREEAVYVQDGAGAQYLAYERDPQDHATPRAMTRLLTMIWQEDWPSPQGAKALRGILSRSQEPVRLGRGLPAGTPLAHKTGTLSGTVNDAGVFELPGGQGLVAISVYVKGARGAWEPVEIAIGDIARLVYDGFVLDPPRPASIERTTPCAFAIDAGELASRLDCGYLVVPERHANPEGASIRLPFVVIRSANRNPRPDPVVFLHGGPGAAPLESKATIERFAVHPFAQDRDIVLYNQRGSRQTVPALECKALEGSRAAIHAEDLSREQRDARVADAASECLRELRVQGRDVEAYGAVENAQDLRALRMALGYPRWNLLAVSYGTWMAQAAARADPEGVRSLLLDSVMSPQSDLFMSQAARNFALGLDRVLAACAGDPECARAFPELEAQLHRLLALLQAKPLSVQVAGVPAGERVDVIVNAHDFLSVIHWMLYNARTLRLVPLLVSETSRGDAALLVKMMEDVYPAFRAGAPGPSPAFFAIVCNDQYTARNPLPSAPANPAYEGFSITGFMTTVCAADAQGRAVRPLPKSTSIDVPALLLSGHFDPMTPDLYSAELASLLPRSLRILVPASGHSTLSDFEACQTRVAQQFLDTLDPAHPHACIGSLPRVQFILDPEQARSLLR